MSYTKHPSDPKSKIPLNECMFPHCICEDKCARPKKEEWDYNESLTTYTWKTFFNGVVVGVTITALIGGLIWLWS